MIGILSVQIVTALYGGETWSYYFPLCNELRVNILGTLPIDDGEYTILNNCTGGNNTYVCDCSDDYYFNVSFKTNTINDYTFLFNYDYFKEEVKTVSTGTSSGYVSSWICGNWSDCINNKTERICFKSKTINYTQFKSCISPAEKPVKKEIVEIKVEEEIILTEKIEEKEDLTEDRPTEKQEKWIYLGIILITVIFIIFGFYVIKRKSHSNSERSKKGNLAILFGLKEIKWRKTIWKK